MKVETKPIEQKPEVVITLSWEEAEVLRAVVGGIYGKHNGREFTTKIFDGLRDIGINNDEEISFSGSFLR